MAANLAFNLLLIAIVGVVLFALTRPRLNQNEKWRATLTPLSSIIGSGFLVMAPLLASIVGALSPLAVLGIVLLAYAIGHVIRFNILHVEPHINNGTLSHGTKEIEYLGDLVLCIAYVTAVAFYLALFSAFLLDYLGIGGDNAERWLTTAIIIAIAVTGYFKGLGGLEKMESVSMTIQLSIVVALLVGLAVFGAHFFFVEQTPLEFNYQQRDIPTQVRMLAGALLVVQGFETSRFLGEKYSPAMRISSMRNAQIISGVLYVVSVILLLPVVRHIDLLHVEISQIVEATGLVAVALPIMLIIAALMSQFSAAVADTGGGGGLLNENSHKRLSTNIGYVIVSVGAIALVWSADLLAIIALASRAFALYYFLQTLLAMFYCWKDCDIDSPMTIINWIVYSGLAVVLGYVVVFAIPAE